MTEHLHKNHVFLKKLTDLVLENLRNENFGVNELASLSGMSPPMLNRRLRAINNKNVNQFILEVRLCKAMEMLQNEDLNANEISCRVGFRSPTYFNKCFHEFFGFAPGQFKKGDIINPDPNILTPEKAECNPTKNVRRKYLTAFPGILILIILLGSGGFLIIKKLNKSGWLDTLFSSDKRISIAVMPFRNMTSDTTWNMWQDVIQECLISSLSNNQELKVRQQETINTHLNSNQIKYASVSPSVALDISKKIDAILYVYGSIKKAGGIIRVDAELIDTRTSEVLKSFDFKRPLNEENLFEISDSLAHRLNNFLIISKMIKENPWVKSSLHSLPNSPEALRYYIYGCEAKDRGDYQIAIDWYLKALAVDSNYFEPMLGLSTAYGNQGMREPDLQWVIRYYKKRNHFPVVQQLWANCAYTYNFEPPGEFVKYLKQLQQIDDQSAQLCYLLGLAYSDNNQYDNSIAQYKRALELCSKWDKELMKDNWAFMGLGLIYHKTGQYKKEKKVYKEAEKYDPDWLWIIGRRAILAFTEKDSISATRYIEKYISVMKRNSSAEVDISTGLASLYSEAGIPDKAIEYYHKALSLDPENQVLLNGFASFLSDNKNNLNEFTAIIDKAIGLAGNKYDYFNYMDTKGYGFHKLGKNKEALDILQNTWDSAEFKIYSIKSHLEEVKKAVANNKSIAKSE
ncbi:MAG: helix-turn-helix domain-containing protein [Bacteroidota bacterium]